MGLMKKSSVLKCECCALGPCACEESDPWTAGRSTNVKLRCTFSGVTEDAPTVGWGAVNFVPGVGGVSIGWWNVNNPQPFAPWDCPPESAHTPTPEEVCDYRNTVYNEGNTWITAAEPLPVVESWTFARDNMGCGTIMFGSFSGTGIIARPAFGTVVDGSPPDSVVTVDFRYNADEDKTVVKIYAYSGVETICTWNMQLPDPEGPDPGPCEWGALVDFPVTLSTQRNEGNTALGTSYCWFWHESEFAGKPCPNASYTFENQGLPSEHVPSYTDSCGLKFGGLLRVSTTGTATLTLIDA